ncbi:MAG: hypothetical protein ACFFEY_16585 [Candidatus Thorarchaeota archaeon]
MIGGSYAVFKLTEIDIARIEQTTGKSVEKLSEKELKTSMKSLDIQNMEMNAEDELYIERIANEMKATKFRMYC